MSERPATRNDHYDRPPVRRKRRKKTPWQKFKEAYLPLIVVLLGIVAIISLIVGIVKLASGGDNENTIPVNTGESTESTEDTTPSPEAAGVLAQAQALASQYDFAGAVAVLNTFTGTDPQVAQALEQYTAAQADLVAWKDNTEIPHISFQPLIVDTDRAFDGDDQQDYYNRNNLTVEEFQAILEELYRNDYVLVSLDQVAAPDAQGKMTAAEILLPENKSPLVMSLVPAHFTAERAADGFASRLAVDADGKLTCAYIDAAGAETTGAYDLVTILEEFLAAHPDFSYRGARAILGLDGGASPLGYDLSDPDQVQTAKQVAQCLLNTGYEFASFTYSGLRYGEASAEEVTQDVAQWTKAYTDLLGPVDILIYAGGSDLEAYEGESYEALMDAGFRYFCSMNNYDTSWGLIQDGYLRQDRRTINGTRLLENGDLIQDLFDADAVISEARP